MGQAVRSKEWRSKYRGSREVNPINFPLEILERGLLSLENMRLLTETLPSLLG